MQSSKCLRMIVIWMLCWVLLPAWAWPVSAQDQGTTASAKKFRQEQLDQILAPIALYPDSLLAQVLMAATYPLEVVLADRWVKENGNLKGDQLNDALDKQPWDVSVKALVPFPAVLSMMSDKLDWTRMVGDAFLAQEGDVMDTVQQLRQKAYAANNLKTTEQQRVLADQDVIRIEPVSPAVVYVPVYDPWWVYGAWWWPAYPPFIVYPYRVGVVITPGFIWFGSGFFVGAYWGHAWGHWGWRQRHIFVNVNRTININRTTINVSNMKTTTWRHDPSHRRGVAYRDPASRERFGQVNRRAVENRRNFRGFERPSQGMTSPAGPREGGRKVASPPQAAPSGGGVRQASPPGAVTSPAPPRASVTRPSGPSRPAGAVAPPSPPPAAPQTRVTRPSGPAAGRVGEESSSKPNAFIGIGQGKEVRRQSTWGGAAGSGSSSGQSTKDDGVRGGSGGSRGRHR